MIHMIRMIHMIHMFYFVVKPPLLTINLSRTFNCPTIRRGLVSQGKEGLHGEWNIYGNFRITM